MSTEKNTHLEDKSIYQKLINGHAIASLAALFFLVYFSITKTAPNTYDIHLADTSVYIAVVAISAMMLASSLIILLKCQKVPPHSNNSASTTPRGIRIAYAIIALSFFTSIVLGIVLSSITITGLQIG